MKQDLKGTVAVVTGANSGIGRETALNLASRGAELVLACRSEEKTLPVIEAIISETGNTNVSFHALDLGSLSQVRESAELLLKSDRPIHLLINNAGLAGKKGQTQDGFELAFGTNHLGHFLWTNILLERIKASAPARIVNLASMAHYDAKRIDWAALTEPSKSMTGLPEYAISKLANVLHAKSLAKRLEGTGVTTYSLHPGVVASDVWRQVPRPIAWIMKKFMISSEEGAATSLYCATSADVAADSGKYYDKCKEKKPSHLALDEALAEELWKRSEQWLLISRGLRSTT